MAGIQKEKMGNATSIFNLMRNIGGSVGIALMTTFLARRSQFHQSRLIERVTPTNPQTNNLVTGLTSYFRSKGFDSVTASRKALGAIYGLVQRHASMLSFVEAFWIMSGLFLAMIPFIFLLRHQKSVMTVATPPEKPASEHVRPAKEHEEEEDLVLIGD